MSATSFHQNNMASTALLDMQLSSYDYELPESLIAQHPVYPRTSAKLMVYRARSQKIEHAVIRDLPQLLSAPTQLIFNQSKVFPCRVMAQRPSGGAVEVFFLSCGLSPNGRVLALLKSTRKKRIGDQIVIRPDVFFSIVDRQGETVFELQCSDSDFPLKDYLYTSAQLPLPPYIKRLAEKKDWQDYQNYFATQEGSVAAPTAGLHFTAELMEQLQAANIQSDFLTLHVGLGTFLPVKCENLNDHQMHREHFSISSQLWERICTKHTDCIAVGTTTLRALQATWQAHGFSPLAETAPGVSEASTDVFLYPGRSVIPLKGLMTNFHLPKSTLLMLVSSLLGRSQTLALYEEAKSQGYRFFSYGDAMLILLNE